MKILGLFRHAKSDWDDMALRDFDRGLNARGRKGAAIMGKHIREHGVRWDLIMASPAERVKLTLEASGLTAPITWEQGAYLADSGTLLALLNGVAADVSSVLIAGHNPGLQDLLFDLLSDVGGNVLSDAAAEKYPTAAFAVVQLAIDDWSECVPGCGRLVHFARPRDLDPQLGPAIA